MNLCIITSSFPAHPEDARAAAGLFVRDFCVELADLGHDVTVLTPDKAADRKQDPPHVDVHWFAWPGGDRPLSLLKPYNPLDALAMRGLFRQGQRALRNLHDERRFDHVLAMWAVPAGVLAMRLKRRHGVPYTAWCLGADIWTYGKYPILKNVVAAVLRNSDFLYADGLALADAAAKLARRDCPFLPSSRRLPEPDAPAKPAGEFRILFIGRYHHVKGVDILLEAMAQYVAEGGKGRLVLYGGGPEEQAIRDRAAQPDLAGRVEVNGFADEATYVNQLAACDVFVIPSRMESIPVVLSDALQIGKPLIVSDVGDMGRLLRETPAGIVVPPEDPSALTQALHRIEQSDPSEFSDAIQTLAQRFDLTTTAQTWINEIQT